MIKKFAIATAVAMWLSMLGAQVTFAQLSGGLMFPGPGTAHTTGGGGGGCGTGVIDLSQGCPMPMLGGVL